MDKNSSILQLIETRKLRTQEECVLFEEALQELRMNITCEDVAQLCRVFCDDTNNDEIMFGVIHLLEQMAGDEYLEKIAICTPAMRGAHDWAMTLNKRIMNSQQYYPKYVEVIKKLNKDNQEKIKELLIDVKNDNPKRFGEKVDMLLLQVM